MRKTVPILLVIGVALIVVGIIAVILPEISGGPTLKYYLSTSVDGQGSVSPGSGFYGEQVILTATPESGWGFDHWEGDASGNLNPVTVTMDSDKTVVAYFAQSRYTLSTSFTPSGSGNVSPSGGTYYVGTQVTVTATPASGWRFDRWSGDASGTSSTVTITMDSKKFVTAHFEEL
jgi:hypothetical protein